VNEELQSTNEELETSKEELQSVNEELATVNSELQTKVADLSRANNDMNNLLAGTGIATVFVDHHLRILRFTPAATRIINLILTDVGRPVGHIVSNLKGYDRLAEDAQSVLDALIPKEAQVESADGKWYAMRILPYRTIDNVIEGVVITFVDITEIRQAEESRRALEQKYRTLYEGSLDAHVVSEISEGGCDLCFVDCNHAALDLLKMTRDQLLAADAVGLSPERQPDGRLSREKAGEMIAQCLAKGHLRFNWVHRRATGESFPVEITMAVYHERGKTFLHSVWRDLTGFTRTPPERPGQTDKTEERS
jgi:two-component system, chemotaxis family, CheB/CheR fusion protein